MQVVTYDLSAGSMASCREEAARVWQKREMEWGREREARDRLMAEVNVFVHPAAPML